MNFQAPIPVGTLVNYAGSHAHGRYIVTAHESPRAGIPNPGINYPDGVAYEIWPENVPHKFGLRHLSIYQVRRTSLTVIEGTKNLTMINHNTLDVDLDRPWSQQNIDGLNNAIDNASGQDITTILTANGQPIAAIVPIDVLEYYDQEISNLSKPRQ